MPTKLSDADIAAIRERGAAGWSSVDIAAEFGVSRRHVDRILNRETRETFEPDPIASAASVSAAAETYLGELRLTGADVVVAETVRTLAAKIDQCRESETAASASAVPALARELTSALDLLRSRESREPSKLDQILARRDAKLGRTTY